MTQTEPTVFIVDDDASVLKSLRLLMKSVSMNAETYLSAHEFLNNYDSSRPGCLVVDIRMPGMGGLELQEKLRKDNINIPVIFITGHGDVSVAVQAIKRGAVDFLEKPFNDQVLLDQIQKAIARDVEIRQKRAQQETVSARLALLTPREREVIEHVIAGKLSKVIARELNITQKTVEFHRAHIMQKMQADSVAELVTMVVGTVKKNSLPHFMTHHST